MTDFEYKKSYLCYNIFHVEYYCVFKAVTLEYTFLKTCFPIYFAPFLHLQKSLYKTRCSQNAGSLVYPKFQSSIHKSGKQCGYIFAFDALALWYALPDDIGQLPLLAHSGESSKHTSMTKHTHGLHQYTPLSSVVRGPCYSPRI